MELTTELKEIFNGTKVPEIKIIDYTNSKGKKKLKAIIKRQKEIEDRSKISWKK